MARNEAQTEPMKETAEQEEEDEERTRRWTWLRTKESTEHRYCKLER
jgi:hypothetical protein